MGFLISRYWSWLLAVSTQKNTEYAYFLHLPPPRYPLYHLLELLKYSQKNVAFWTCIMYTTCCAISNWIINPLDRHLPLPWLCSHTPTHWLLLRHFCICHCCRYESMFLLPSLSLSRSVPVVVFAFDAVCSIARKQRRHTQNKFSFALFGVFARERRVIIIKY